MDHRLIFRVSSATVFQRILQVRVSPCRDELHFSKGRRLLRELPLIASIRSECLVQHYIYEWIKMDVGL